MASQAGKPRGTDSSSKLTASSEKRCPRDLEALDATAAVMEEKIVLCDLVFNDLLAIQRIVQEKGHSDAAFQEPK